jgi:hypothetical protein
LCWTAKTHGRPDQAQARWPPHQLAHLPCPRLGDPSQHWGDRSEPRSDAYPCPCLKGRGMSAIRSQKSWCNDPTSIVLRRLVRAQLLSEGPHNERRDDGKNQGARGERGPQAHVRFQQVNARLQSGITKLCRSISTWTAQGYPICDGTTTTSLERLRPHDRGDIEPIFPMRR